MINDNAPRHTLRTVNNCIKKEQKNIYICRELKQRPRRRRRQRQRERQKSIFNWFRLTKQQLYTCITFFVHFFAVVARLRRETSYFQVLWRTWTQDNNFHFLFLNFDTILWNSTPEKIAIICRIERDGINLIKFEAAWIYFLNDGFVAVAVVVALKASLNAGRYTGKQTNVIRRSWYHKRSWYLKGICYILKS